MNASRLVKLGDTEPTVSESPADIRGRWVIDRNGEEIGYIDDLLIDDQERKIRFLQIASGGVGGVGQQRCLLPVEAVTRITEDEILVDQLREHMLGAPPYEPHLAYDSGYYRDVYAYYGYPPY